MSPETMATMLSRFWKKGTWVHSGHGAISLATASFAVLARRGLMRSGNVRIYGKKLITVRGTQ